ncbi:MAG: Ldh family oxidoreductase [Anaerolineales bacterium]|nr:Ldh family oxidoreductase [Anaerolineales bacterium]
MNSVTSKKEILVRPENLEAFVAQLFSRAGMAEAEALFSAEVLVRTNLWGIDTHGVLRVPVYIRRLLSGAINPMPQIKTHRGAFGLEVLDGDNGHGFVVGRAAIERAIDLAEQFNVGVVGAIRSNHFGASAIYSRIAVERGFIGIAMTNVVPNMTAPGGSKPVVGNNPLSLAFPTFGEFPFVLDISLSNVSGGKILLAGKKGEKIPLDWATDTAGRPTDDPEKAFAGFLLPLGGYKGLGLAYAIELLCGVMTGGVFLDQMKGMYKHPNDPSETGHLMIAINPLALMSEIELQNRMAVFCTNIKESPMWDETQEMLVPGEIEYRTEQERREKGIPLPSSLYEELQALGNELAVESQLAHS